MKVKFARQFAEAFDGARCEHHARFGLEVEGFHF